LELHSKGAFAEFTQGVIIEAAQKRPRFITCRKTVKKFCMSSGSAMTPNSPTLRGRLECLLPGEDDIPIAFLAKRFCIYDVAVASFS